MSPRLCLKPGFPLGTWVPRKSPESSDRPFPFHPPVRSPVPCEAFPFAPRFCLKPDFPLGTWGPRKSPESSGRPLRFQPRERSPDPSGDFPFSPRLRWKPDRAFETCGARDSFPRRTGFGPAPSPAGGEAATFDEFDSSPDGDGSTGASSITSILTPVLRSMARSFFRSSREQKETAMPVAPARAVRPIRWT